MKYRIIELLAVISIFLIIILIGTKLLTNYFTNNIENYNNKIESIITVMKLWASDNELVLPKNGDSMYMTLYQLQVLGYTEDIINPKTNEPFPSDTVITLKNVNDIYEYDVKIGKYINIIEDKPILKLGDNVLKYINIDSNYAPSIIELKDSNNNIIKRVSPKIFKQVNGVFIETKSITTKTQSIYKIIYSVKYSENNFQIIQNIIVK